MKKNCAHFKAKIGDFWLVGLRRHGRMSFAILYICAHEKMPENAGENKGSNP